MAVKLEICISFNEDLNKHHVEYSTAFTSCSTHEERQILTELRTKLLCEMDNEYVSNRYVN
ncbi:hypothetical protein BDD30_1582 [Photorhabdus asymbiotica]|uniref:Uncharacterized protein n=1 Tax=Photorhabdus asymbiotica TaxID=291112 RepID=A0ABX9SNA5_9GAMM|nr:hypothetical protein BDD30_1582 [Photorhabdus asymbiotica]